MNSDPLNRREFLKLAGLLSLGASVPSIEKLIKPTGGLQGKPKNVIVIVFDAFSAYNIPVYGYKRATTPNIARLAKRAIVYHNHFAGGNFTSPGTASLLTGVLPWTHRAFRPNSEVAKPFASKNIFEVFKNHYRIAYSHNGWAYTLLKQFGANIEELIPPEQLMLGTVSDKLIQKLFRNDDDIASVSWQRAIKFGEQGQAYSLFLSHLYEYSQEKKLEKLISLFPRGIPDGGSNGSFVLETATQTTWKRLTDISQPFVAYFHYLPPHGPYRTSSQFYNVFKGDTYKPIEKPIDTFGKDLGNTLVTLRRAYDEFVLYCDAEFAKLYDHLESSGILENSWLVLTSDHGEMNERGIGGHMTNALYQPVVRVPLMIFEPGRTTGMDIYDYTSAIDVLPTLAHISGETIPNWTEGVVLPPFNSSNIPERNLYTIRANHNDQFAPFTIASTMIVKENYKLHYYFGYPEVPPDGLVRLFDIKSDPEELTDLSKSKPDTASALLHELKTKLEEVDQPYR